MVVCHDVDSWELNPISRQEQQVVLTAKPLLILTHFVHMHCFVDLEGSLAGFRISCLYSYHFITPPTHFLSLPLCGKKKVEGVIFITFNYY